jgi:hypothetical protein
MPETARDELPITPALVTWARKRAGLSVDEAARTFTVLQAQVVILGLVTGEVEDVCCSDEVVG